MKNIQASGWIRRLTALSLAVVLYSTSVSFLFAATSARALGEISVSGGSSTARFVWVNGEKAFSGRTFVSGALIATEADSAAVRLNNGSSIRLEANSSVELSFSETSIGGRVISGKVDVFAAQGVDVNVTTPDAVISDENADAKRFTLDLNSGTTTMNVETGSVLLSNGNGAVPVSVGGDDERDGSGKCVDTDKDGKLECDCDSDDKKDSNGNCVDTDKDGVLECGCGGGGGMAAWKPAALFAGIIGTAVVALLIATRDNEESPRR